MRWIFVLGLTLLGIGCGAERHALVLSVYHVENAPIRRFDLLIKATGTGKLVLSRVDETVSPSTNLESPPPLKIGIEFAQPGDYLIYMAGKTEGSSVATQFALRYFVVNGIQEATLQLMPLTATIDSDGDGIPACGTKGCDTRDCTYFDCDDANRDVHPFATERCGNGLDDDCSAGCDAEPNDGDELCDDADGDGVSGELDCDDTDPCRASTLVEKANTCGDAAIPELTQRCRDRLEQQGKPIPSIPYCGDGIDQDCVGGDVACDLDCDGFSVGTQANSDCNDADEKIHPGATEVCGDNLDNNCNKIVDEGCVPCDVDGDGFAATDHPSTDATCASLPKTDPDDFDAGVRPDLPTLEGGTKESALRRFCSYGPSKNPALRIRDMDHDGDGLAAKEDGCPTESCDLDGDGFARKECNPPLGQEDCDDADLMVFPGAPDRCGDGKAQNCVADTQCDSDADGDGFNASDGDCDDANDKIYPWVNELCDGKDNDCDGLIDEGNPGPDGTLIAIVPGTCTDSNVGVCGEEKTGICVCSPTTPTGIRNAQNRNACLGENLSAPASPRCFNATQPSTERCDLRDWDCDGKTDDPEGNNLLEVGQPCSITVSDYCRAGTVIGCDHSRDLITNAADATIAEARLKTNGVTFNQSFVCSADTVLPRTERCNGFDDDCDGVQNTNEKDFDNDKYLACTGCQGNTLKSSLVGCGDCQDTTANIHPGRVDLCNGIDDDCNSSTLDGTGQCIGATPTCCASLGICINTSNDVNHCGGCGVQCDGVSANRCVGGVCQCGNDPACGATLNCVTSGANGSASCQCIVGGRCNGCCDGNSCRTGNSTSFCGLGGEACDTCTATECLTPQCSSAGNCSTTSASNGTNCTGGKCVSGSCCAGCLQGSGASASCQGGTSVMACGTGGASCQSCTSSNPCRIGTCQPNGTCGSQPVSDPSATACSGGVCLGGNCCTGCRDAGTCATGTSATQCGDNGAVCQDCTVGIVDECKVASCNANGTCGMTNAPESTPCAGGTGVCLNGVCCTGCINGNTCVTLSSTTTCGIGGDACVDCTATDPPPCQQTVCNIDGTCGTQDAPPLSACNAGSGVCIDGSCCEGCVGPGQKCEPGTADTLCGDKGATCQNCTSTGKVCNNHACQAGPPT